MGPAARAGAAPVLLPPVAAPVGARIRAGPRGSRGCGRSGPAGCQPPGLWPPAASWACAAAAPGRGQCRAGRHQPQAPPAVAAAPGLPARSGVGADGRGGPGGRGADAPGRGPGAARAADGTKGGCAATAEGSQGPGRTAIGRGVPAAPAAPAAPEAPAAPAEPADTTGPDDADVADFDAAAGMAEDPRERLRRPHPSPPMAAWTWAGRRRRPSFWSMVIRPSPTAAWMT